MVAKAPTRAPWEITSDTPASRRRRTNERQAEENQEDKDQRKGGGGIEKEMAKKLKGQRTIQINTRADAGESPPPRRKDEGA